MSIFTNQVEALQLHLLAIGQLEKVQSQQKFSHVDTDMVEMMLEQAARFSEEFLVDLAEQGDLHGCTLTEGKVKLPPGTQEVYEHWCQLGFPTLGLPMEYEGLDFPRVVQCAIQELGDSANLAFGMLTINLRCAALALIKHAPQALTERWVPGLVSGEITATIAISEPQAGSDVGRIRVTATPSEKDKWTLSGSKIWISYGDHDATEQIIHLVLARVPGSEVGTRGLGLFVVPKYLNDTISEESLNGVIPSRLEHKMGLHASPTCVLDFNDAEGYIIGEPGQGIQQLFVMMNAMRLAVSVQGSAVANAATLRAINYAQERPQGGRPDAPPVMISEHTDVKRMLLEMTAASEMLRGLSLRTAYYLDMADAATINDESELASHYRKLGELLLPIAKTVCSEVAFETANQGIQVLAGYGYTNDYPLERMLRDVRVGSIYEGTSGIQALDFMKRKVIGDKAACLQLLIKEMRIDLEKSSMQNPLRSPLSNSLQLFEQTVAVLLEMAEVDKASIEAGAYHFLRFAGLVVCAWNSMVLFDAAASSSSDYHIKLRAALTLSAGHLEEEAKTGARKSVQLLPKFSF